MKKLLALSLKPYNPDPTINYIAGFCLVLTFKINGLVMGYLIW